mmetsp:Transcript_29964/g.95867  ORF Transcript_29964/g.95867 Transcript_29964/m.95867 type:complete len:330 (+) Transcript_29964:54-1043(+)
MLLLSLFATSTSSSSVVRLSRTVGERGSGRGQFDGPRHVAALKTGGAVIVDGLNERIQVFDRHGECVRIVEGVTTPTGVAIGGPEGDTLYWAESTRAHRVNRLQLSAKSARTAAEPGVGRPAVSVRRPWASRKTAMGGLGEADGELQDPQDLCLHGDELYVAEWGNHRISVFDKTSLAFLRHIGCGDEDGSEGGEGGSGPGQLDQPCGVACAGEEVFVCDTWNHRISVFDRSSGSFLRSLGRRGGEPGEFNYPCGIEIAHGRIYVTERTGKRLQALSLEGEPLQVLPAPCDGWLYGICLDAHDQLWVTSSNRHCVHILSVADPNADATR